MTAYVVSLERLASLRRSRLKDGLPLPGSSVATGADTSPFPGAARAVQHCGARAENGRIAKDPPETRTPSDGPKEPGESATVQEFLDLPQEQIEAWLKTHGGSEARVLLAMLCRLASLETRLSEVEGRSSTKKRLPAKRLPAKRLPANSLPTAVGLAPIREPVKSDLLEQVFQKNLLLRRGRVR